MKYFSLLKKVSFVSFGNILNAFLGLVFFTACAKILSVEDFGKYALLTSFLVFMSKFVDFGSNSVFVAGLTKGGDFKVALRIFYLLKFSLFVLALLFSVVVLSLLKLDSPALIAVFVVGLFFYSINITLFAFFQLKEMFLQAVLLNTIPALAKGFIGALLILGLLKVDLIGAYVIFSFSMGLCVFVAFFLPKDFYKIGLFDKTSRFSFWQIVKASFPGGVSLLITQGWSAISNFVLKFFKGFGDVGVFYLADRISNVFNILSISIFTVILPRNAKRRSKSNIYDFRETLLLSLIVLILAFVFIVFSGLFVRVFFGGKFDESLVILDLLIFSSAISAIHLFMENYFYVFEDTKKLMLASFVKLGAFLILSFLFIPALSLRGFAFSHLLASLMGLFASLFFIYRSHLNIIKL